ncbi:hypothetical protein PGT21_027893 [Puccinia graminis f. sp. tritici]|uniref:Uncharacterized protein n=1 Tax=Puccinia graminis f. sp. tritici TaxID=56615 RepID=A0A5B0NNQ4_PUCGR|nr:hypothetical protein PGT21_027893 [Puccinia graminis f. sp. tritici]
MRILSHCNLQSIVVPYRRASLYFMCPGELPAQRHISPGFLSQASTGSEDLGWYTTPIYASSIVTPQHPNHTTHTPDTPQSSSIAFVELGWLSYSTDLPSPMVNFD